VRVRVLRALDPQPAFLLHTGDVTNPGRDEEYNVYQHALSNLSCPIYNCPGNHDIRWNPLGKEGYTLGTKEPLYHAWDYGGIHFVNLDSTVLLQHWGHFDRAEVEWHKADLAKLPRNMPIVIGFHHWIGREEVMVDNEQELLDIVAPYNVRLWLQGHGHS